MDRNERIRNAGAKAYVATREGGVDRNIIYCAEKNHRLNVATREGGVDRNSIISEICEWYTEVATREGGVDRNSMLVTLPY